MSPRRSDKLCKKQAHLTLTNNRLHLTRISALNSGCESHTRLGLPRLPNTGFCALKPFARLAHAVASRRIVKRLPNPSQAGPITRRGKETSRRCEFIEHEAVCSYRRMRRISAIPDPCPRSCDAAPTTLCGVHWPVVVAIVAGAHKTTVNWERTPGTCGTWRHSKPVTFGTGSCQAALWAAPAIATSNPITPRSGASRRSHSRSPRQKFGGCCVVRW